MQNYTGIAVAGTHGKTTTTAMIAWILSAMGKDPSYIIGGVSKNLGNNAHSGRDAGYFVIEADEYDRMFLGLLPKLIIVTNTQHDHPDCFPTAQIYQEAFQAFTGTLEPGGILLACGEDYGSSILADFVAGQKRSVQVYRYGSEPDDNNAPNDYYARNIRINNHGGFDYEAWYTHQSAGLAEVSLKIPGKHNLLNSLAALAATHQLHLPMDAAAQSLSRFSGTERRFDLRGEPCGITIIDDYAHHPTEIQATLQSARLRYPNRRIWAIWQPHTFSRIQALYEKFLTAFTDADCVIVTDVYASRENNVAFSIANLVDNINHSNTCFIPSLTGVTSYLLEKVRAGDVVLVLSAGDANLISTDLLHELSLF